MALKRHALTNQKFLSGEEQKAFLHTLEKFKNDPKCSRDVTLLWFMFLTGARAGETLSLLPEHLLKETQSVFLYGSKASNSRELPLPPWLFKRLVSLARSPEETLFGIGYPRLVQIWHMYRPAKKKLHSLRHTFATNFYKRTLNMRLLQLALGHRSILNTQIYLDYQYSLDEFRKAMDL